MPIKKRKPANFFSSDTAKLLYKIETYLLDSKLTALTQQLQDLKVINETATSLTVAKSHNGGARGS